MTTTRAIGKSLAEDIDCNGYHFDRDIILNAEELGIIDSLPLTELKVSYGGKIFTLRKFSKFTFNVLGCKLGEDIKELSLRKGDMLTLSDVVRLNNSERTILSLYDGKTITRRKYATSLELEDLYTAFGIWSDNLNGFDLHSKQFEITNRVLVSYDKKIEVLLQNSLAIIMQNIRHNLYNVTEGGQLAICVNECCDGVDVKAFIDSVANTGNSAGQMSDMCNLLAYVSKSNKATTTIKRIIQSYNAEQAESVGVVLPDFSRHTFRHTFITRLVEANVNVKVIQDLCGHVDSKTTLDIYTTVTQEWKQEQFSNFEKILNDLKRHE